MSILIGSCFVGFKKKNECVCGVDIATFSAASAAEFDFAGECGKKKNVHHRRSFNLWMIVVENYGAALLRRTSDWLASSQRII